MDRIKELLAGLKEKTQAWAAARALPLAGCCLAAGLAIGAALGLALGIALG